jgi:hypothetical protein
MEQALHGASRPLQTRVIAGTLYERLPSPYAYDARVHHLGNGMVEASLWPVHEWREVTLLSPRAQADYEECLANPPALTRQEQLDRAADNRKRSTQRARTTVRRLAKVKSLTTMLTLTYRENMTDRARMARDWDAFVKRVRRLFPSFEFVCVFEQQKRGAWHAHIAVRKLAAFYVHNGSLVKSYDLFRALWRGVVGKDNGTCNHGLQNKRIRGSISKLAGYLTKYIGKHFDGNEKHANSYSASGRALPGPEVQRIVTSDYSAAVEDLRARLLAICTGPVQFHQAHLDAGGYFVAIEPAS